MVREVAQVQGQAAGKEDDSDTSDENGPLPVPKSARVVSGRGHHLLRMLVGHLMCRDGMSEESLLERRAVRSLAERRDYQTVGRSSNFPLVEDVEIDGALVAYSNDCFVQEFSITMVHSFLLLCWIVGRFSAALGPENFRVSIDV